MADNNNPTPTTLPWKTRLSVKILTGVTDLARRSNGTINRTLLKVLDLSKVRPQSSKNIKQVLDVSVDSSRDLWFRLFVPKQDSADSKLPVLIFFHGGGFSFFSPDIMQYDQLCRQFAEKLQVVVVSVNYRLSPEHKLPAPYDDGFDVLRFLDRESVTAAADLSRCFVAGDSAGGNIAHHVVRRYAETAETDFFIKIKIMGLIAMQPYFGGEERTESEIRLWNSPFVSVDRTDWHWKAFLPEGENRDHGAVNVFGPYSTDISVLNKFPDTIVFVGGMDPLQDWQTRYYMGLKKSGNNARLVEYPNAIHAFYVFPELPEAPLVLKEIRDFICNNGNVNQRSND